MNILKLIFTILMFPIYSLILLLIFITFGFIISVNLSKLFVHSNINEISKYLRKVKTIKDYIIN